MRTRIIVAVALMMVGGIWIGQGLGFLDGTSFMVGDQRWAIAGAVAVVVGLILAISVRWRRPTA